MFEFENPSYFLLLLLVLLSIVAFVFLRQGTHTLRRAFGSQEAIIRLIPKLHLQKTNFKFGLIILASIFLIIALANPRLGAKTETIKRQGVDVFLALDISKSMWAQDLLPSRMQRAKQMTNKLINSLKGDRIGLILFAGQAFLQMPLTVDYSAALLFAQNADPQLDIVQGTALGEAILVGVRASQSTERKKQRALVIITDGENHEEDVLQTAKKAKEAGVNLFIIGVGTTKGAPIPLKGTQKGYQLDKSGQIVQSKMNEVALKQIAKAGGGNFWNIEQGPSTILKQLQQEFQQLEKEEFEQQSFDTFQTYFQWFVALGVFILFIEFFISYRKGRF